MIPYGHQHIDDEDLAAVAAVLRSDWLTQGPMVEAFEKALASYCGVAHVVTFSNGTTALQGAYFAADFGEDWEFITSPLTFAATSNAAIWQGGRPVFVDVDPATGNIDPKLIEAAITPKTKAIVPIDYAGNPVQLDEILEIARRHNLLVIEDACHALGASFQGKKIGSIADMSVFSFHPVKPITTGEGGAVATNSAEFAARMRQFRTHGITKEKLQRPSEGAWYYEMQELGTNARLTDLQSALGLSQLKKLDGFVAARQAIAQRYDEAFAGIASLRLPSIAKDATSGWHLYPMRVQGDWATKRKEVFDRLRAAGIGVQVHYVPVHLHPYYESLGYQRGICPKAEAYYEAEISLPIFPDLSIEDQTTVINAVKQIVC